MGHKLVYRSDPGTVWVSAVVFHIIYRIWRLLHDQIRCLSLYACIGSHSNLGEAASIPSGRACPEVWTVWKERRQRYNWRSHFPTHSLCQKPNDYRIGRLGRYATCSPTYVSSSLLVARVVTTICYQERCARIARDKLNRHEDNTIKGWPGTISVCEFIGAFSQVLRGIARTKIKTRTKEEEEDGWRRRWWRRRRRRRRRKRRRRRR